jgi:hypothetical protein
MAVSDEEVAHWRDKLEFEKAKVPGRKNFPSDVNQELDALEKELAGYGYDPEFLAEILRQIAQSLVTHDGNVRLRLRWARSIIKGVKSGDPMEMLLVVQMICVYGGTMTVAALMNASKDPEHVDNYGNICNKFARTYVDQMGALQRWRSGPQPSLQYNVSVRDGGQAIVGNVTQNAVDKGKADSTKSPPLVSDQSATAMPIIETGEQSAATVPRTDQDNQPAPSAKRRKRRG